MAEVKIKLTGLNKLMTSQPVASEVMRQAKRLAAAAGPSFKTQIMPKHRYTAGVGVMEDPEYSEKSSDPKADLSRAVGGSVEWEAKGSGAKAQARASAKAAKAAKKAGS